MKTNQAENLNKTFNLKSQKANVYRFHIFRNNITVL